MSTFDENAQPAGVDPASLDSLPFFAQPKTPQPTTREEQLAANLTRSAIRRGSVPADTGPAEPQPAADTTSTGAFGSAATSADEPQTLEERSALPWDDVNKIRDKVARVLSETLAEQMNMPLEMQKQLAQGHIKDNIAAEVSRQARDNVSTAWTTRLQNRIQRAVFDALFNLGRLQPLVDEPGVENIHIGGFDNVWLSTTTAASSVTSTPSPSAMRTLSSPSTCSLPVRATGPSRPRDPACTWTSPEAPDSRRSRTPPPTGPRSSSESTGSSMSPSMTWSCAALSHRWPRSSSAPR